MPIRLPKLRLTLNPKTGKISMSKITPKSVFNATVQDATKKAPPMPYVRNRWLRKILKLLMSK